MAGDKRSFNNADLKPIQVAGLKKKAVRSGQVQLRVGGHRITVPVDVFVLTTATDPKYAFVSVQAINAVVGAKSDGSFEVVDNTELASAIATLKAIRKSKARTSTKVQAPQLSAELEAMLKKLPKGYKLAFKEGGYGLVKSRPRATK